MYRQGLGDCFLLAFGRRDSDPFYVLIDCGVHARETDGPARLMQVMKNLQFSTGGHLNVVVATHEHADHLSGFVQKGTPFLSDQITIDQLWVAWTEKRGDAQADDLRRKRGSAQELIDRAVEECRKHATLGADKLAERILTLNDFERPQPESVDEQKAMAILRKARGPRGRGPKGTARTRTPSANELALAILKSKAQEKVQYCEPGQTLQLDKVENVRAFAMGPPRTSELLKKDGPTKIRGANDDEEGRYKEVYLSGNADALSLNISPVLGLVATVENAPLPDDWRYPFHTSFRREFKITDEGKWGWAPKSATGESTKDLISSYLDPTFGWRRIDSDWLGCAGPLALNLDSDINNTSLVLSFECGPPGKGIVLLFPGDAQVGNWLSWIDHCYQVDDLKMDAGSLLSRTLLYKVGHHGSHNATLRRNPRRSSDQDPLGAPYGLELMDDIVAMIPVDWDAAKKPMPDPWRMPHEPLYRRLRDKARRRILRSDEQMAPLDESAEDKDLNPPTTEFAPVPGLKSMRWRRASEMFSEGTAGPLYYDVEIQISPASASTEDGD